MFRKFFNVVIKTVKTYIKNHGIIKSICNAVEAAVLGSGIVAFITSVIKRWRTNRKFKKLLKAHGINEKEYYSQQTTDQGVYDDNGYRLTNEELYRKNMHSMQEIEDVYTDEIRECVELIEKFEPSVFKGMTNDEKFKYVYNQKINACELRKKYGLDKETQLKKGIDEDDIELEEAWDEPESSKIGVASKVNRNFKRRKKPGDIIICNPIEYAAMEITYGCDNFNFEDPNSEPEIRRLRRMKFDETVEVVNSYMSWVYLYDDKKWKIWMLKNNNDAVMVWKYIMIAFLDNVKEYNQIKEFLADKAQELNEEIRGHKRSKRPKITSIEDDQLFEKMETVLERLDELHMDARRNSPTMIDEDEKDEDDPDNFDEELKDSDMSDTDDILDQLDALRNGEITSTEENNEKMERKPVKLIQPKDEDDDINDPTIIVMNPKSYTIEARARKMLTLYDKLYKEDVNLANCRIQSMLSDEEGKNYAYYEKSDIMKNNRQTDRSNNMPFKLVPQDYSTKEESIQAFRDFQANAKTYGMNDWKQLINERTQFYRDRFEYQTVDIMLEQLNDIISDHDEQVAFIRCLREADHDYTNNILASKCVNLFEEAEKISQQDIIQEMTIVDNTDAMSETGITD